MPRKARFAPPGYYLHITQRGNYRQRTFLSDEDRNLFLDLLAFHSLARQVNILAYCLMPNHFHLVARGATEGSVSRFMQCLTGHYAQLIHGRLERCGRFWQQRFYACVLDDSHLRAAVRYVELNPVRAGIATRAEDYPWSSAAVHAGDSNVVPEWLDVAEFQRMFAAADWRECLAQGQEAGERAAVRSATRWESPLGREGFIEKLEADFGRKLQPCPVGRPRKAAVAAAGG